ncbi:MAG: asparagine synthase-related protein, partial [Gammaproteobacteria bacterium]|nr:asparagine synthase-related protein [Gammaproteobacteria bacterium]
MDISGTNIHVDRQALFNQILESDVAGNHITKYFDNNLYCIYYDNNAYQCSGIKQDSHGMTIVTGEPIIDLSEGRTRESDAHLIHDSLLNNDLSILKRARGVFSGININLSSHGIKIFTDKLGIRPIYYYCKDNLLIFSSILNYFEKLTFLELEEDFKGICETIAMGFPLSNRTQYKDIKLLQGGDFISIGNNKFTVDSYFDWSDASSQAKDSADVVSATKKPNSNELSVLSEKLFDVFQDSVKLRLGDEKVAIAFLSGGLDSRCVTSALKTQIGHLHTFNFGSNRSQDGVFAKLYCEKLGSKHHEEEASKVPFPNWSELISNALIKTQLRDELKPVYPQKVWSGDGGSVGLGFVYLNKEIIDFMNNGDTHKAILTFLSFNKIHLPARFISNKYKAEAVSLIYESMINEFNELKSISAQRRFYLFLMFNDQQRHLFTHFETIGKHKIELVLPYFDSDFLSVILSIPVKYCLGHNFYMEWFKHFP